MAFQDPGSYIGYLHEEIQFGIKNANAHYNYIALIQSSGYGKSRAVGELSKLNYWILLFCFRSNESSGFPPKTPKSNDFLKELHESENADDAEKVALLWISASVRMIKEYKGNGYDSIGFWEMQIVSTSIYSN